MMRLVAPLALAFSLVAGLGCEPSGGATDPATADDPKTQPPQGDPASTAEPPVTAVPAEDPPPAVDPVEPPDVEPLPEEWIKAPLGWCDKDENLYVAAWVVDGDTIELTNGAKVRYIGVDAPETYKDECWSYEAKSALMELTPIGQPVCLQKDYGSASTDPYGRWLRYIFVQREDGAWVMQNARLVRLGSARAYHQFLKGKDYATEILKAETDAKGDHLGGWSACSW